MRIMKFGGTSLADAAALRQVASLVTQAQQREQVAVVVSAFAGVTDQLLEAADTAVARYETSQEIFATRISRRHLQVIDELIPPARRSLVVSDIQVLLNNLEDVLHGVHLVRECSASSRDLIVSYGERLSARIVAQLLQEQGLPARAVDARPLVLTARRSGATVVELEITEQRIRQALLPYDGLCVITGYIGSNRDGITTTLGRNGSDYTATIFGAALAAEVIEIWSDVDGVSNADPRLIPEARTLGRMTFEEVQEMAYFGASIIHPQALQPAAERDIPVVVRNTFKPDHPGTWICRSNGAAGGGPPVRAITTVDGVALVNLEGSGMIGVPGIAGRLFTALAEHGINIIMISQASSEHSICFVTRSEELATAVAAVRETFAGELAARLVQQVEQIDGLAVLSIIGSRMRGTVGLSGRFFAALGSEGVNVLAISQGSSERNISIVIDAADRLAALRAVHTAFQLDQVPDAAAELP